LGKHSGFFDAAINNTGFLESQQNEIILPVDDPLTFEFLVTWIYTKQFSLLDYLSIAIGRREDVEFLFLRIFEKYIIPELQALAYDRIIELFGKALTPTQDFMRANYVILSQATVNYATILWFDVLTTCLTLITNSAERCGRRSSGRTRHSAVTCL